MIESLFPSGVGVAESTSDLPDAFLFPEEAEFIAGATTERLTEFRTGRWCARRALAQLGYPEAPILSTSSREPVWPTGCVGSITHCDGYRAAIAARSSQFAGIGIDAEPNAPLPDDVLEMISTEREYEWVATADESPVCRGRLLFSAKESLFKAWYPIAREWLDFKDVELSVAWNRNEFVATFTDEAAHRFQSLWIPDIRCFLGRFLIANRLILTSVTLPQSWLAQPAADQPPFQFTLNQDITRRAARPVLIRSIRKEAMPHDRSEINERNTDSPGESRRPRKSTVALRPLAVVKKTNETPA